MTTTDRLAVPCGYCATTDIHTDDCYASRRDTMPTSTLAHTACAHEAIRLMLEDGHDLRQLDGFGHTIDDDRTLTVQDVADGNMYLSDACDTMHNGIEGFDNDFDAWIGHLNKVGDIVDAIVASTTTIAILPETGFFVLAHKADERHIEFPKLTSFAYEAGHPLCDSVVLLNEDEGKLRDDLDAIYAATREQGLVVGPAEGYDLLSYPLYPIYASGVKE